MSDDQKEDLEASKDKKSADENPTSKQYGVTI